MVKLGMKLLAALSLLVLSSGCGVLFGNIKPVVKKSANYSVSDLSRDDTDWVKVSERNQTESEEAEVDDPENELSDIAYQSKKTDSIIALNSVCRPRIASQKQDLQLYTNSLILGISEVKDRNEQTLVVAGKKALQTTIEGKSYGQNMMLRAVVLHHEDCVYDLTYVSSPENFKSQLPRFEKFVSSLKID